VFVLELLVIVDAQDSVVVPATSELQNTVHSVEEKALTNCKLGFGRDVEAGVLDYGVLGRKGSNEALDLSLDVARVAQATRH